MSDDYVDMTGDYQSFDEINYSILFSRFRLLPFYNDDVFLGMQAMNIGIVDQIITVHEFHLRDKYIEIEKTPLEEAMTVGALSQMWIYALYEVLRLWRDRRFEFDKLYKNGGVDLKLNSLNSEDDMNFSVLVIRDQLKRYRSDESYRTQIDECWQQIEPVYRMVELFRINLAKYVASGKKTAIPRMPGYGRINMLCGSLDYELIIEKDRYDLLNRRDIADCLRQVLLDIDLNKK